MEPTTHTPGPWLWGYSENPAVYNGQEHLVILTHPELSCGLIIADLETQFSEEEQLANAHLIAAAPDLLEALELAVFTLNQIPNKSINHSYHKNTYSVCYTLESAIAKAKGE